MQNQKFEHVYSVDCYISGMPSSLTRNGPANIQPMISPRDHKSMDFSGYRKKWPSFGVNNLFLNMTRENPFVKYKS